MVTWSLAVADGPQPGGPHPAPAAPARITLMVMLHHPSRVMVVTHPRLSVNEFKQSWAIPHADCSVLSADIPLRLPEGRGRMDPRQAKRRQPPHAHDSTMSAAERQWRSK